MKPSHRRIASAVDAVCDAASGSAAFRLDHVIAAVARARGRRIYVETADLTPGVCGQRLAYDDHDVIQIAPDLPNVERTLAHELGHIVFRHTGSPVVDSLEAVNDELREYLLSERSLRSQKQSATIALEEWEAEAFAGQLLQRLRRMNTRGASVSVLRFDQALG